MTPHHPDDDALSAHLDGEATPEEDAHIEGCDACRARLESLRRAASLLAVPVPPVSEAQRAAAITAAVDARAVSLGARRRRPVPGWLVGAAAVVLLGLGLVPILLGQGAGDDRDDAGETAALDAPTAEEESATMSRAAAPVDAGDLGDLGEGEIAERVAAALVAPPRAVTDDGSGAEAASPSPGAETTMTAEVPCVTDVRATDASLGELRLHGRATVDGRRVVVLVFDRPGATPAALRAYVVGTGDCGNVLPPEPVRASE